MPLVNTDPEFKAKVLQAAGYDPSKYSMDDDGNVSESIDTQPTTPQTHDPVDMSSLAVKPPTQSPLETGLQHAGASAFPSLSALAGGALAAEYLPLAHVAMPWSEIAAGLVGALVMLLLTLLHLILCLERKH